MRGSGDAVDAAACARETEALPLMELDEA